MLAGEVENKSGHFENSRMLEFDEMYLLKEFHQYYTIVKYY